MATPCLQEEEMLAKKVHGFTGLYDEWFKGFKGKYAVQNAWEKVGESLDFEENGNFIRASSNWEHFEDSCSEKIDALFEILTKNISKSIWFLQMLFWILIDWQLKTVLSRNINY